MRRPYLLVTGIILILLAALATACTSPTTKPEDTNLKMGLLPIMDILPFHVAQQEGYFQEEGITVQFVPVKSAQERDTLMQTGQIDGELTDLISIGLFDKDKPTIKIVRTARKAYPDSPQFRILAAPNSNIKSVTDLKGVKIGISQNTIIEYLTDRLLEAEGLSPDDIAVQEVSQIPVRFELLMKGQIKAATLPDPLASGAVAAGATVLVDDSTHTKFAQSVLAFSVDTLQTKPNTVKKFLKAWEKAATAINEHPEKYQDLLIEKGRVPKSIQGTYVMPPFPEAGVPTEAQWQDVVDWLLSKKLIDKPVSYKDAVDATFLP
ncbi:MAG: ABC transporter substrate-binding protein [Chloroflexi bacterium]|nr:ABC transporter substrate-binding protein [Chloroflexota bacterium]